MKNCRCCHGFFICFVFTRTKNGGISTPTRPPVHIVNKYVMSSVVLACAKKTQVQKPASRKNRQRQHEASKKETSIDPCSTSIAHPPLHPRRDFIFFDRERDYASLATGMKAAVRHALKHQIGSAVQPCASDPKYDQENSRKPGMRGICFEYVPGFCTLVVCGYNEITIKSGVVHVQRVLTLDARCVRWC